MSPRHRVGLASALLGAVVVVSCVLPPAKVDDGPSGGGAGGSGAFGGGGGGAASCSDVTDCGDPANVVCDPATLTCQPPGCSTTIGCASDQVCVVQTTGATVGACYPSCVPDTGCANGATCSPTDLNGKSGACWPSGAGSDGQACSFTSTNTDCVQGLLCGNDEGQWVCRSVCNFWSGPLCPSGQYCNLVGGCFAQLHDPTPIGGTCGSAANTPCGNDGFAWTGICASDQVCRRVCRADEPSDCLSPEFCNLAPGESVGLCAE